MSILGAGRLLDIDHDWLTSSFECIHLVDYDPGCRAVWKKLQNAGGSRCRVNFHHIDVTGVLEHWTEILKHGLKVSDPAGQLPGLLAMLMPSGPAAGMLPRTDVIISLNLLSQLPLYWRDRVIQVARGAGILEEDVWRVSEVQLEQTMSDLQSAHVSWLKNSGASRTAILTDTEFYYYDPKISPWQVEAAVSAECLEALNRFGGQRLAAFDCWLWHIAPAGEERAEYGEIHRVEARLFERPVTSE